jgi:hypothetical protein
MVILLSYIVIDLLKIFFFSLPDKTFLIWRDEVK